MHADMWEIGMKLGYARNIECGFCCPCVATHRAWHAHGMMCPHPEICIVTRNVVLMLVTLDVVERCFCIGSCMFCNKLLCGKMFWC